MKHLTAGLIVGGVLAVVIGATMVIWWFLGLFVGEIAAATLTGAIILVMAATAALDWITEKRA